jgi:hypothetical protein
MLTSLVPSKYVDGMETVGDLGRKAKAGDPAVGLRAAATLRRVAEELEVAQVRRARELGWSWRQIALMLNLTKQAVHHKYAAVVDEVGE